MPFYRFGIFFFNALVFLTEVESLEEDTSRDSIALTCKSMLLHILLRKKQFHINDSIHLLENGQPALPIMETVKGPVIIESRQ
jgi:hypothetical protein